MFTALDETSIRDRLRAMPAWSGDLRELRAKFEFQDFRGAMQFMAACVDGIDQRNHHPIWSNKFNVVEVRLSTFDIGNFVTGKDFELAQFLDEILRAYGAEFGHVAS
jgi:4a-hydroxytetrahydrobiopterin dehydratase